MDRHLPSSFVMLAAFVVIGCAGPRAAGPWVEPRPLGRGFDAHPPRSINADRPPDVVPVAGDITLRDALARALLRNPELAAFGWEVRAAEARALQASLPPNPEVSVGLENFAGTGDLRGVEGAEATVALSQLVELGGKRAGRIAAARAEEHLAAWDYETKRMDVFAETAARFVDVLAAQERLALTRRQSELAGRIVEVAGVRVRAGAVSPVEETRARVEASRGEIALRQAERDLVAARHRLAATWGDTTATFSAAAGVLDTVFAVPTFRHIADRLAQNPALARWTAETALREANLRAAWAGAVPDVAVGIGIRRFQETDANALVAELAIPLPVFDRNPGERRAARFGIERARSEQQAAIVAIHADLVGSYEELAAAYAEVTALRERIVPDAEAVSATTEAAYRQGKIGFLDVLDAQRTLTDVRREHIDALATYHRSLVAVERLIGEPLAATHRTESENGDQSP